MVASVLAMIAAACTSDGDGGAQEEGDPQPGGELVVGLEAETNSWLPGQGAFANPGNIVALTFYDPLMVRLPSDEIVPYLAESLEPNDDHSEWTLTLRSGVKFHDGTDLTADVIETIFTEYLKVPTSNVFGALAEVESFTANGELTGVYKLTRGNVAFPDLLIGAIGWPFSIDAAEAAGEDAGSAPVGTGPFEFASWERDDRLVVTRNASYWQEGLPYLDRVVFRPIPDEETRLQSLLSGDINVMQTLRQSTIRGARDAGDQVERHEFIGNNGGGAIFNTALPPVDDARVRQGLAYAINQDDLVDILGGRDITPVQTQWFNPESPFYSEAAAEEWPAFDATRAEELLGEYINDPDRSDGKDVGDPIAVEFNCPPDPSLLELSQAYQAFWSAVGVDVKLNQVEQATHIQNAIGSPQTDPPFVGDYMVNCWRMGGEGDPYNTFFNAFGPPAQQPLNFTNYTSDVVNAQVEVLRTSTDAAERQAAVEAIMLHFAEAVPNLWTGSTAVLLASRPEVNGLLGWATPGGDEGGLMGLGDGATTFFTSTWLAG